VHLIDVLRLSMSWIRKVCQGSASRYLHIVLRHLFLGLLLAASILFSAEVACHVLGLRCSDHLVVPLVSRF